MKDTELKVYPFCGSDPEYGSLGGWAIWCPGCGVPCCETGLQGETLEYIKNMWNRRYNVSINL